VCAREREKERGNKCACAHGVYERTLISSVHSIYGPLDRIYGSFDNRIYGSFDNMYHSLDNI